MAYNSQKRPSVIEQALRRQLQDNARQQRQDAHQKLVRKLPVSKVPRGR